MNARVMIRSVVALALACSSASLAGAAEGDEALSAALRAAVAGNVAAYDKKDVDGAMSFVHTKSPDYDTTKAALPEQFQDLGVTSELVDFDYIGHDDEFAVGRAKMKTTGKPESEFQNNTVDTIVIFHMENGAWKLWSQQVLGVEILP